MNVKHGKTTYRLIQDSTNDWHCDATCTGKVHPRTGHERPQWE